MSWRSVPLRWLSACAALVLLVAAGPGAAFTRSTTTGEPGKGLELYWGSRSVVIKYNSQGTTQIEGTAGLFQAYRQSMKTWSNLSCTDFTFVDGGETTKTSTGIDATLGKPDRENLIIFRDAAWPHQKDLLALTTVIFSNTTGEIVDTDLELNSFRYQFTISDTEILNDVQNTVTHELGHVLGLDHPCGSDPACSGAEYLKETTMYQNAPVGEVKKRDLTKDDIDGVCAIYPLNTNADSDVDAGDLSSGKTSSSCRAIATDGPLSPWPLVAALLLSLSALAGLRRRA